MKSHIDKYDGACLKNEKIIILKYNGCYNFKFSPLDQTKKDQSMQFDVLKFYQILYSLKNKIKKISKQVDWLTVMRVPI